MSGRIRGLIDLVSDNLLLIVLLLGGYIYGTSTGIIEPIELPTADLPFWYQLVVSGGLAAAILGIIAAGKIYDLLPEAPRVYIVEVSEEDEENPNGIYRLTPDAFEETRTAEGRLYQWPETKHPTYECVTFDPAENRAVGTWRESVPASEIVGKSDVKDAIEQISEVRKSMEKEARWGHAIRRRIASIIRALDRERGQDMNAALEGHVAPTIGDGRTTDDVIREQLGALAPRFMREETDADPEQLDEIEGGEFDMEIEEDALETVLPDGGGDE